MYNQKYQMYRILLIFLTQGIITTLTVLDNGFNRIIYGYDSYGNICDNENKFRRGNNETNDKIQNTSGLKLVMFNFKINK